MKTSRLPFIVRRLGYALTTKKELFNLPSKFDIYQITVLYHSKTAYTLDISINNEIDKTS